MALRPLIFGFVILVALMAASFANAAQTQSRITIPFSINDMHQFSAPVEVGERDAFAIIDTGATYPMVDRRLLTDENSEPKDERVRVLGIGGERLYPTAMIDGAQIGEATLGPYQAAVSGDALKLGNQTIFPASIFEGRVLDFQFEKGRLDIYDSRPKRVRKSAIARLKYEEVQKLPFIRIKVNGVKGRALVDTGSTISFMNGAYAREAGLPLRPDRVKEIFGVGGDETSKARISRINSMTIGMHRLTRFEMFTADPPLFESLGLTEEPVLVLGLDILRHFRLQIDRKEQRVYLAFPYSLADGTVIKTNARATRIR